MFCFAGLQTDDEMSAVPHYNKAPFVKGLEVV